MADRITSNLSRRNALQILAAGGAAGAFAPHLLGKPAFAQSPPSAPTGRIVVGISQEATVFNPLMAHIEVDDGVHFSIFDALFRIAPNGTIEPALAAEVPTQANGGISADGLNWNIKLRKDVRWHDGKPFTAEDVKFTLELIVNPNFRAWRTTGHSLVRDIKVVSPTEISWRMERAFAPYLSFLTETFIVPQHILGNEANLNNAAFNQAPVGTGAFKWGQRVPGDRLELVANPEYFGGGPYIKQLIFKYIPNITVLYTQFKSGDIDLVGQAYISPDNVVEAKTLRDRAVTLVPKGSVESIYFNLKKPQFQELAVRQALYMALDRKSITEQIYNGVPQPTETFMPPQSYYFNSELPVQEFNLKRANQILDEAGWKRGSDGVRSKNGVQLAFSNATTSGDNLREQTQQFIQQVWAELGVKMTINNLPPAVMWGDFWTLSQFDTAIVGISFLIGADPDVTNRFHSSAITAQGGRGSNNAQYSNSEVDKLLEEGSRTFDPEARRKIYRRIQELVRNDLPFLPLYSSTLVYGRRAGIKGYVANTNTRTESWHAAGWYWG